MAHTAANTYKTNPVIIEVFNADIDLSNEIMGKAGTPLKIRMIDFHSAAAGDVFALQEDLGTTGTVVVQMAMNVNGGNTSKYFGPLGHTFQKGLVFDTSEVNSGLGAGDRVLIYLA